MNTDLLLNWLNLPPGNWPPDERALLGIPAGPVDAALAEQNALARMEQLRPYQLKHPELVTEGMNKLAQALLSLITPVEAAPPPPQKSNRHRTKQHKPEQKSIAWEDVQVQPELAPPKIVPWEDVRLEPEYAPAPQQPAEPQAIAAEEVLDAIPIVTPQSEDDAPAKPVEIPAAGAVPPPAGTAFVPRDRRKGYREVVFLRRWIEAWDRLAPTIGTPSESFRTAASVFGILEACAAVNALVNREAMRKTWFRESGSMVISVVRYPQALQVLRELALDQRRTLAHDWAESRARWQAEMEALRTALRQSVPRNRLRQLMQEFVLLFRNNPEWILGILTVIAVTLGVFRQMLR